MMNIILIFNGLGNQMSQYAFYLACKKHKKCIAMFNPTSIDHNGSELDKIFGIKYTHSYKVKILEYLLILRQKPYWDKLLDILGVHLVREPKDYMYDTHYIKKNFKGITFLRGGWHSEKYFLDIRDTLLKTFKFPISQEMDKDFQDIVKIIKQDPYSVSIHVRRGDYVSISPDSYYQFGNVATPEYYHKAIDLIKKSIPTPTFYVFSNDIAWCKSEFSNEKIVFVTCNCREKSWRDLYLMTICKHHINANSTFSWWGAWLSIYKDGITIVPHDFIRNVSTPDIYPDKWYKI